MRSQPLYDNPEELEKKIAEYFEVCNVEGRPRSLTGLCYFLGFESKQSYHDYEKRPAMSYVMRRARLEIERFYEESLTTAKSPQGPIFALKNFGWRDEINFNPLELRAATAALFPEELLPPEYLAERNNETNKPKLTPPNQ
jgi:hypothetical protein